MRDLKAVFLLFDKWALKMLPKKTLVGLTSTKLFLHTYAYQGVLSKSSNMISFKEFLEAYGDSEYGPIPSMTGYRVSANQRFNGSEYHDKGIRSKFAVQDGFYKPNIRVNKIADRLFGKKVKFRQ